MGKEDAQKVLSGEILEDGRRRAERLAAAAGVEADKLLQAAREEAKTESAKILSEARARAEARRQMFMHTLVQEVQRRKLAAREDVIQKVFEEVGKQLQALSGDAYRQAILRLATDAVRQVPDDSQVLRVAARGEDGLEGGVLAARVGQALAAEGRRVSLRVELDGGMLRGAIAESNDGRLRCDNTFDTRLRRWRIDLRRHIASVLFEEQ